MSIQTPLPVISMESKQLNVHILQLGISSERDLIIVVLIATMMVLIEHRDEHSFTCLLLHVYIPLIAWHQFKTTAQNKPGSARG